jgi:hypothetical protein
MLGMACCQPVKFVGDKDIQWVQPICQIMNCVPAQHETILMQKIHLIHEDLKLSETNQCTQFVHQDQKQWEEAAMMLAISIQPDRKKVMTKETKKKDKTTRKKEEEPNKGK